MKLQVTIDSENSSFEDNGLANEIEMILRKMLIMIEARTDTGKFQNLRDTNGNIVGSFKLTR